MTTQNYLLNAQSDGKIPTVITNLKTIVPAFHPQNALCFFVPEAGVKLVSLGGIVFQSAPLAVGRPINLLDISYSSKLIEAGLQHPTDALNRDVCLENIYFKVPEEDGTFNIIKIPVLDQPSSKFVDKTDNSTSQQQLDFFMYQMVFDAKTKSVVGALTGTLGKLLLDHDVTLDVTLKGLLNTISSCLEVLDDKISFQVRFLGYSKSDQVLSAKRQALINLFQRSSIIAYDVLAYRL